jgi:hypothetical protein
MGKVYLMFGVWCLVFGVLGLIHQREYSTALQARSLAVAKRQTPNPKRQTIKIHPTRVDRPVILFQVL